MLPMDAALSASPGAHHAGSLFVVKRAKGSSATIGRRAAGGPEGRRPGTAAPREVACCATRRRGRGASSSGQDDEEQEKRAQAPTRRAQVIRFVQCVQPGEVEVFIEEAPPSVVAAMKQTVSNMVGALPPQHFSVTVSTVADSLASLLQSMLRTGYLLRGVQYQLDLELALQGAAASMMPAGSSAPLDSGAQQVDEALSSSSCPSPSASTLSATTGPTAALPSQPAGSAANACDLQAGASGNDVTGTSSAGPLNAPGGGWSHPEEQYAPGVQLSGLEGDVLRWHAQHGLERMPATSYIHFLEQQVAELQRQQQAQQQQALRLQLQQQQQQQQQAGVGASPSGFQPFPPLFTSAPGGGGAGASAAAAAAVLSGAAGSVGGGEGANPVLAYLRSLDASSVAALGACGPDVSDAMTAFVARLLGTAEQEQLRQMTSEFSAFELSQLLFWLLVVGWSLRALEVRLEVEEGFGSM